MAENNSIKATSFRVNETDIEKFKLFSNENNMNQQEAFNSLINTLEMAKAKNMITDRAKEVEVFQDTVNNLMSMFINSLSINQSSEERIRAELSLELNTKDQTIKDLQEERNALKIKSKSIEESNKDLLNKNNFLTTEVEELKNDVFAKNKQIELLNNNNINQLEQLEEYKEYKIINGTLSKDNKTLSDINNDLTNNNKQLNDKINNNADMIIFYKDNIGKLNSDIELLKQQLQTNQEDIKALEVEHKQELGTVKSENKKALEKDLKETEERLIYKNNLELDKKDLEIQRLNNEIKNLKPLAVKPRTKTKL